MKRYFMVAYQYSNSGGLCIGNDVLVTFGYINYNKFMLNLKKRDSSIKGVAIISIIELSEVDYADFSKE